MFWWLLDGHSDVNCLDFRLCDDVSVVLYGNVNANSEKGGNRLKSAHETSSWQSLTCGVTFREQPVRWQTEAERKSTKVSGTATKHKIN
jgi:hypothetical protein